MHFLHHKALSIKYKAKKSMQMPLALDSCICMP